MNTIRIKTHGEFVFGHYRNDRDIFRTKDIADNQVMTAIGKSKVFHLSTKESNDGVYLAQLIHKVSNGTNAKASIRCNRKGWGCDYFVYITVNPLYIND